MPTVTSARMIVALVIAAFSLTACDAGRRVCLGAHITGADDRAAAGGDTLRVFWFDDADDALFEEPVEDLVRRVGEARYRSVSRGIHQRTWVSAKIDPTGHVAVSLGTFYAGGYPISDLVLTKREENPEGLWMEIVPASTEWLPQAFVVRDVGGTPTLVRLRFDDGHWRPDAAAGSITVVGWDAATRCYRWEASIPLEPWTRP